MFDICGNFVGSSHTDLSKLVNDKGNAFVFWLLSHVASFSNRLTLPSSFFTRPSILASASLDQDDDCHQLFCTPITMLINPFLDLTAHSDTLRPCSPLLFVLRAQFFVIAREHFRIYLPSIP